MRLGRKIPRALRDVLVNHARSFSFEWERNHVDLRPHPIVRKVMQADWTHAQGGRCLWSLDLLPILEADVEGWRQQVYSDPADPYGRHWYGVFAVCGTGLSDGTSSSTDFTGGDFFAIRENASWLQPVVFLSHDGARENGQTLAESFEDFLLRWSAIGCVGGQDGWALGCFITESQGGLDPTGETAVGFRQSLGVELA
jgi:hypothetical protein